MESNQSISNLVRYEYQSIARLDDLLGGFLKAVLNKVNFSEGVIQVPNFGVSPSDNKTRGIFVDYRQNRDLRRYSSSRTSTDCVIDGRDLSNGDEISVPIVYQGKHIGRVLSIPGEEKRDHHDSDLFSSFAREVAFMIKRYEASDLAKHYLGKNLMLLGCSEVLREVESFIENASQVNYPVIIQGEFGTEKVQVASAIHYNSERRNEPFVEINCAAQQGEGFEEKLEQWFRGAGNGTIFFNGIDELGLKEQSMLPWFIESGISQWIGDKRSEERGNVRIIVSTSRDLATLVELGVFSKSLFAELNFLNVHLKPLRMRSEDIEAMLDYMLEKYRRFGEHCFSAEVLELLKRYDWPENLFELERVVARLLTLSCNEVIGVEDVKRHVPEVVRFVETLSESVSLKEAMDSGSWQSEEQESCEDDVIVTQLLLKDFSCLKTMHPGLQKAMRYMAENYTEEISLGSLAKNAFISTSHLSFLFKSCLNRTFKQILAAMRIEKAKELLRSDENHRITDISFDVGFGDLSHFEKIFKRIVGVTPREYRRQMSVITS